MSPEKGRLASPFFFSAPVTVVLGLVLGLVALVYSPGLAGPFLFDDLTSIITNPYLTLGDLTWSGLLAAAQSGESGPLGRPIAYASFALNHWAAGGFDPVAFKATNLAVHLLNTALVYRLSGSLLRIAAPAVAASPRGRAASLLAAGLWGLHPLQLTSVLYVVQRMTSLSATAVLLGLIVFLAARSRLAEHPRRACLGMALGLLGGTALGLGAKENAVLLPALALLIELTLLPREKLSRAARRGLLLLYGVIVAVPLAAAVVVVLEPGWVLAGYEARPYGPWERLLTEARVLFRYLAMLVAPRTSDLALVHDDIVPSAGLLEPWTTLPAVLAWLSGIALALAARHRHPWLAFALGWFLVGHSLESGVIALDIAHEHRNYLPALGPVLALAWYVSGVERRRAAALALIALGALGATTWVRASVWRSEHALTAHWVRHHPESARAYGLRAQLLLDAGAPPADAFATLAAVARLDPHDVSALTEMLRMVAARLPAGTVPGTDDGVEAGDPLSAVLPAERTGLETRATALTGEIDRRLAAGPVGATTVGTLHGLAACVLRGEPRCLGLGAHAERWLGRVLEAHRLPGRLAAPLWAQLARLVADRAPDEALAHMRRASAAAPERPGYAIALAHLHLARGEPGLAETRYYAACGKRRPGVGRALERLRADLAALGRARRPCR